MVETVLPEPCDAGTEGNPSDRPFSDSEDDFAEEGLADSDKAGQEAPMTGPTSPAAAPPFDGLFQADRLPTLPPFGPLPPPSEFSPPPVSSTRDGEEEADGGGEEEEQEESAAAAAGMAGSVTAATADAAAEGEDGTAAIGSDSPRTT